MGTYLELLPLLNARDLYTNPLLNNSLQIYDDNVKNEFLVPRFEESNVMWNFRTIDTLVYKQLFSNKSGGRIKSEFVPKNCLFYIYDGNTSFKSTRKDRYGDDLTYILAEDIHRIMKPLSKNRQYKIRDEFTKAAINYVNTLSPDIPIILNWW